jgi:hypothetical protein
MFCSCATIDQSKSNYWILFRYNTDSSISIIGECIMPYPLQNAEEYEKMISSIEKKINEKDAFDLSLDPLEKDRLEISICFNSHSTPGIYRFLYQHGKWIQCEAEIFDILSNYRSEMLGLVKFNKI